MKKGPADCSGRKVSPRHGTLSISVGQVRLLELYYHIQAPGRSHLGPMGTMLSQSFYSHIVLSPAGTSPPQRSFL